MRRAGGRDEQDKQKTTLQDEPAIENSKAQEEEDSYYSKRGTQNLQEEHGFSQDDTKIAEQSEIDIEINVSEPKEIKEHPHKKRQDIIK